MRSFGPVPITLARSTPSSRANARTEGDAWAALKPSASTAAAGAAAGRGCALSERGDGGFASGGGGGAACAGGTRAGSPAEGAAGARVSSVRMTLPSLTLSPCLTLISFTTPDDGAGTSIVRSEEHTSELQSRRDLVCRLLLEKKKKNKQI